MVHRCIEHHTPIGLAAVPIRVFLRDVRPPPGFSIADFNDRIVDTISSTNPSSEKTPGSDEREEIHTCKLGILRLKLVSLVPVSSAMHNQLERGTVLA